jgi:hypothetical protein
MGAIRVGVIWELKGREVWELKGREDSTVKRWNAVYR